MMNIRQRNYIRMVAGAVDPKRQVRDFLAKSKTRWTYRNAEVLRASAGNAWITKAIRERRPAAIGKIGRSELKVLTAWRSGVSPFPDAVVEEIFYHSGVFPRTDTALEDFCLRYSDACRTMDLLSIWGGPDEKRIVDEFCPTATLCELEELEPYYHKHPWSAELEGLDVLVVSPFVDSIARQFGRRREIWSRYSQTVLPDFNLKLVRAHHSEALQPTGYANWRAMCEDTVEKAASVSFDVAIIGFGAASLPICADLKRSGKVAIHLGGAAQILFGLLGARWDHNPRIGQMVNSHWSRPSPAETPSGSHKVERGAYW